VAAAAWAAGSLPETAMLPEMSMASIVVSGPISPAPLTSSASIGWPFS
jgi:hypothetical protein